MTTKTFADRAYELQLAGLSYPDVVEELQREGALAATAQTCARHLDWNTDVEASDYAGGPVRHDRASDVAIGLLCLAGGVLLTVATYAAASSGGTYVIAWGPAVYGLFRLMRGASS